MLLIPEQELSRSTTSGAQGESADLAEEDGPPASPAVDRLELAAGVIVVVLLAGLVGWFGFRAYEAHNAEADRNLFVQVAFADRGNPDHDRL
jgi:hypothetical protein